MKDSPNSSPTSAQNPSTRPSGRSAARPRPRNNWNPLSGASGLDFGAFALTLIAIATFEFAFGVFVQIPLRSARVAVDKSQLTLLYGAWGLASLLGFWCVTNTFLKRWATIYEIEKIPRWMKLLSRFLLLSPLLSIWATLFTAMFSAEGTVFKDGEKKSKIVLTSAATLIVFHTCFLGYRMVQREIALRGGRFELLKETSMRDSLPPGLVRSLWLPGRSFSVHFYPYLSPLTKLGLSVYGDFARAKTLADQIPNCDSTFIGQKIPNCYFEAYREIGLKRPFVTPAFGVIFESKYRHDVMKSLKAETPIRSFAYNSISVETLLALLEPGELVFDRKKFLRPIGILRFFGSPELPAISFGQDSQHFILAAKLVPILTPQLEKLAKSLDEMKGALTPDEEKTAVDKMNELRMRLKALASDPLSVR